MCMGGKAPDVAQYTPAPTPVAVTSINPIATAQERAKTLANMRSGLAATIKTPTGFTGSGTQLQAPMVQGVKKTLG